MKAVAQFGNNIAKVVTSHARITGERILLDSIEGKQIAAVALLHRRFMNGDYRIDDGEYGIAVRGIGTASATGRPVTSSRAGTLSASPWS